MNVGNTEEMAVTVLDDPAELDIIISISEAETGLHIGTLTVRKEKGISFLEALTTVYKEALSKFPEFEKERKIRATLKADEEGNQSGTMKYMGLI